MCYSIVFSVFAFLKNFRIFHENCYSGIMFRMVLVRKDTVAGKKSHYRCTCVHKAIKSILSVTKCPGKDQPSIFSGGLAHSYDASQQ